MQRILRGASLSQGASQRTILRPFSNLNEAKTFTLNQDLQIRIQGLLRHLPSFPAVCQLKEVLPWMLLTTLHHKESSSSMNLHRHLAKRAKKIYLNPPRPRPPSKGNLLTASHLTRCFNLLPLCPSRSSLEVVPNLIWLLLALEMVFLRRRSNGLYSVLCLLSFFPSFFVQFVGDKILTKNDQSAVGMFSWHHQPLKNC